MIVPRLICLLLAGILASAAAAQSEVPSTPPRAPMTFEIVDTEGLCEDCVVVQAQGRVMQRTTGRDFWIFVARHRIRKTMIVMLHSSGGSMQDAMEIGSALRKLGAQTVVGRAVRKGATVEVAPASCLSACPMIFAGGLRRAVPTGSQLGVHSWMPSYLVDDDDEDFTKRHTLDRRAVQDIHASNARYMEHLDAMGIDLRLMTRIFRTPYERMDRLGPQDLRDYRLVTEEFPVRAEPGRTRPVLALPKPAGPPPAPAQAGRGAAG